MRAYLLDAVRRPNFRMSRNAALADCRLSPPVALGRKRPLLPAGLTQSTAMRRANHLRYVYANKLLNLGAQGYWGLDYPL